MSREAVLKNGAYYWVRLLKSENWMIASHVGGRFYFAGNDDYWTSAPLEIGKRIPAYRPRKPRAEIYTSLGAQGGLPQWEDFYAQFEDLYVKLNGVNHLLLRFRT